MNRAEIAREQTKKQREIIEYHRTIMKVYSEINQSVGNGEFKAVCTIPALCIEQIVNDLIDEGFTVEEPMTTHHYGLKKIIIRW